MTPDQFMANFSAIAEAPGGIDRLRELVLDLALTGQLSTPAGSDEDVAAAVALAESDDSWRVPAKLRKKKLDPNIEAMAGVRQLPPGWVECRMEQVVQLINGRAYKRAELLSEGVPIIRIQNLNGGQDWYYSDLELPPRQYCDEGDLLFAWSASFGPYIWWGSKAIYHYHIWKLNLSPTVDKQFFFYVLMHLTDQVRAQSHGLAMLHMTKAKMERWPVLLPPLAEQKRIVAKVDQLMAMLDDLEQRQEKKRTVAIHVSKASLDSLVNAEDPDQLARAWERVSKNFSVVAAGPVGLARLREAIGVLACTGKLTATTKDDRSVERIIDAVEAERRAARKKAPKLKPLGDDEHVYPLPSGWRWVRIGELLLDSDAGKSPQCEKRPRVEGEYGVLKVSAVSWGSFRPGENKALPEDIEPFTACEVHPGDYLLSRANTGELVARSVVVSETPSRLLMSDKIVRLHFCSATERRFFSLYNNGPAARDYYLAHASGTSSSMKNVSRKVMLGLPVPLPPLEEQKRIVTKVDLLMATLDQLEQQLEAKQALAMKLASVI